MILALGVGVLVTGGVFLVLQRGVVRVAFGFVLLGHAVNLLLLSSGGTDRREPAIAGSAPLERLTDPIPQAFVLTAIVITFGITILLLALAARGGGDDDTEEEP
ncbi:cation:proton antiporter subunit C [Thermobifida halotolerans]|uniref:Cation:proton antiporter subunit C n=1 Tax=Thermobifida halotolerans TaxID=483545 RepID=A0A399G103_9ACTN|nr:cation:proton antiporter subunit C [Thermobifida halotolerans]UOE19354.1 cation:proton antiporter subunit C [Thermobifida halotolerans]